MKTQILASYTTLMALLISSAALSATPVTAENAWSDVYDVQSSSPHLRISNIWGSVRVRGGRPGEIAVSVTELRSAPDRGLFELSERVLTLHVDADPNGVDMHVGEIQGRRSGHDRCLGCRVDIQFDVWVPPGTRVDVSTVQDGRVDVEDVSGIISAYNVNGPVRVTAIHECESIKSVNGEVELGFSAAPIRDCNIETVNGDITVDLPVDSGLDVNLDLFNGEIFSELQTASLVVPATVEHTIENGRNQYRIQQLTGLRIGAGGPTYSISSINGDVRIVKNH